MKAWYTEAEEGRLLGGGLELCGTSKDTRYPVS